MRLRLGSPAGQRRLAIWVLLGAAVFVPAITSGANAQSIRIVAFGASNTAGKGVNPSAAWPARLEGLLKAKGAGAEVVNAGLNGDTSCGMMGRMDSAVPPGTHVVILQPSGCNDRRRGCSGLQANIAQMKSRLAARRIRVVHMDFMGQLKRRYQQPDGIHLSAEGHARAAAMILPQVLAAIRR